MNCDNWLHYINSHINQYQLQICLLRTKIKNRVDCSHKIVTRSYNFISDACIFDCTLSVMNEPRFMTIDEDRDKNRLEQLNFCLFG